MTTNNGSIKRAPVKQRTPEQLERAIAKVQESLQAGTSKAGTIDYLCNYALNRIETLKRDADKRAALAPPKEPKVKKEKPAKTPKEPKAKAPKAEKPAKAPAPAKEPKAAKAEAPAPSNVIPLSGDYLPRARKLLETCKNEKDLQSMRETCAKNLVTPQEFSQLDEIYSACLANIDAKKAAKAEKPAKQTEGKKKEEKGKKEAPKPAKANKQSALF